MVVDHYAVVDQQLRRDRPHTGRRRDLRGTAFHVGDHAGRRSAQQRRRRRRAVAFAGAVFAGSGQVEAGVVMGAGFAAVPAAGAAVGGLAFASVGVAGPAFAGPGWAAARSPASPAIRAASSSAGCASASGPVSVRACSRTCSAATPCSAGRRAGHRRIAARTQARRSTPPTTARRWSGLRPASFPYSSCTSHSFSPKPDNGPICAVTGAFACFPARRSKLLVVQADRRFQPMCSPPVVERPGAAPVLPTWADALAELTSGLVPYRATVGARCSTPRRR